MAAQPDLGPTPDPLDGWSLPAWTYRDPEFFELEKARVFAPNWQVVCHESDLPDTGAWHALEYIGESGSHCMKSIWSG